MCIVSPCFILFLFYPFFFFSFFFFLLLLFLDSLCLYLTSVLGIYFRLYSFTVLALDRLLESFSPYLSPYLDESAKKQVHLSYQCRKAHTFCPQMRYVIQGVTTRST
ncbi:hypothetical protein HDV57DRAFT_489480 [Trichoderma longibrachiatum]